MRCLASLISDLETVDVSKHSGGSMQVGQYSEYIGGVYTVADPGGVVCEYPVELN